MHFVRLNACEKSWILAIELFKAYATNIEALKTLLVFLALRKGVIFHSTRAQRNAYPLYIGSDTDIIL